MCNRSGTHNTCDSSPKDSWRRRPKKYDINQEYKECHRKRLRTEWQRSASGLRRCKSSSGVPLVLIAEAPKYITEGHNAFYFQS
eukprot:6049214-Pleurochrysis_carterae.AAC.5